MNKESEEWTLYPYGFDDGVTDKPTNVVTDSDSGACHGLSAIHVPYVDARSKTPANTDENRGGVGAPTPRTRRREDSDRRTPATSFLVERNHAGGDSRHWERPKGVRETTCSPPCRTRGRNCSGTGGSAFSSCSTCCCS